MFETNEQSFLQILDAVRDLIFVKSPNSRFVWANKSFCEYVGTSVEELRGKDGSEWDTPEHMKQYLEDDAKVFTTGKALEIPQEPIVRHDGEIRTFNTVKCPIYGADGKVFLTVGISRDITDRLETEDRLRAERARSMYSAKMASLGEMAAGVAHEINNPLTIISCLSELSLELLSKEPPDTKDLQANVAAIGSTSRKIAKIVTGLRTFSRDAKGDPLVPCKLRDILEETLAFSRERMSIHDIELRVIHAKENPEVECRAAEIGQVLLNLLNNAFDAIVYDDFKKWIEIESRVNGEWVEVSVTDSGEGISQEDRERLFTPFFTTKDTGKGTGLGLSISKGILEAHKGELFLDPDSEHTRFVFRLKRWQGTSAGA